MEFNEENAKAAVEPWLAGYEGEELTPAILRELDKFIIETFGERYGVATNADDTKIFIYDDEERRVVAELV